MANGVKRIGIITSGGDCGGLNAIIKGAALAGTYHGIQSFVIPHGYAGLYNLVEYDELVELTPENRGAPHHWREHRNPAAIRSWTDRYHHDCITISRNGNGWMD